MCCFVLLVVFSQEIVFGLGLMVCGAYGVQVLYCVCRESGFSVPQLVTDAYMETVIVYVCLCACLNGRNGLKW